MVSWLTIFFTTQKPLPEALTDRRLGGAFDKLPDNGILNGVKDVQTSFDQRRLTFFRK